MSTKMKKIKSEYISLGLKLLTIEEDIKKSRTGDDLDRLTDLLEEIVLEIEEYIKAISEKEKKKGLW